MSEQITFNGFVYRRYPSSEHLCHRRYYNRAGGKGLLHRDIWEHYHGSIPNGFHVHHVDGNVDNNCIENLECVPAAEHFDIHREDRRKHGYSEQNLAHMQEMREKAKEWHASAEGRAWHKEVSSQYLDKARQALVQKRKDQAANPKTVECMECGELFPSPTGRAKVCSQSCHSKRSRRKKRKGSTANN